MYLLKNCSIYIISLVFLLISSSQVYAKCLAHNLTGHCILFDDQDIPIPPVTKEISYCRKLINCDPNQFNINSAILVARQSGIIHNEAECLQFTENVIEETRHSYGNAIPYFEGFAAKGRSQGRDACAYQFRTSPPTNESSHPPPPTLPQPRPTPSKSLPQPNLSNICQTDMMWCNVGQFAPIGTFCWCNSQFGQLQGQIVPQ